jgi:hypothetical protein
MAAGNLNFNADFVARRKITTPNAAGIYAPATGISDWTVRISATQTGAAIGSLSGLATEYTTQGFYARVFDQANLQAELAALLGTIVYIIWSRPGDVDDYYTPWRVTDRTQV